MTAGPDDGQSVHATAVAVGEAGMLILGASGSGKSRLAMALIAMGRQGGRFTRLVGDDRVRLRFLHGRVVAGPHPAIAGRIEERGVGILETCWEAGAVIRCVVSLGAAPPDRMPEPATVPLGPLTLPCLALQSGPADELARRTLRFLDATVA